MSDLPARDYLACLRMSSPINEPEIDELSLQPRKTVWWVLALPVVLAVVILFVSPNFQPSKGVRPGPLGGDYLQEWVGGTIIGSPEKDLLYDEVYSRAVQHDVSVVGFEWDAKSYFPMVYPPFYYWMNRPLAELNYSTAMRIWTLISAFAISISAFLLGRFYPPCRRLMGTGVVLALIYVPLLSTLNMGQSATFLLLILSGTFLLLHHRRPFSAGLLFGLIAFKPHLGIVIGLTMLAKRQGRFALGAILMVGILVGATWVASPTWWTGYWEVVSRMGDYVQTAGYQLSESHSLWGATQLTFFWLGPLAVKLIAGLLSVGVIYLLAVAMQGPIETDSIRFARQFSAMVIATVMLSPHFYTYDLSILLVPMLLVASSYLPGQWRIKPIDRWLGFVLITIFALAGSFATIASTVRIQPSVLLLVAALGLIGATLDPRLPNRLRAFLNWERSAQSLDS